MEFVLDFWLSWIVLYQTYFLFNFIRRFGLFLFLLFIGRLSGGVIDEVDTDALEFSLKQLDDVLLVLVCFLINLAFLWPNDYVLCVEEPDFAIVVLVEVSVHMQDFQLVDDLDKVTHFETGSLAVVSRLVHPEFLLNDFVLLSDRHVPHLSFFNLKDFFVVLPANAWIAVANVWVNWVSVPNFHLEGNEDVLSHSDFALYAGLNALQTLPEVVVGSAPEFVYEFSLIRHLHISIYEPQYCCILLMGPFWVFFLILLLKGCWELLVASVKLVTFENRLFIGFIWYVWEVRLHCLQVIVQLHLRVEVVHTVFLSSLPHDDWETPPNILQIQLGFIPYSLQEPFLVRFDDFRNFALVVEERGFWEDNRTTLDPVVGR